MASVILECIRINNKLRIRFNQFISADGNKVYNNAYNNQYNCRFPKKDNIRVEGRLYKIPDADIVLVNQNGKTPFYSVKNNNITIYVNNLDEEKQELPEGLKIFNAEECIVCLDGPSEKIFLPCGHKCTCENCSNELRKFSNSCPMCRRIIQSVM